jgi:hypothetical protein
MSRRLIVTATLAASLFTGCSTFQDKRTPSGDFCSDMPVLPAGQVPDREYHRLQPVASDPECRTEAERLESLRKSACKVGADAVIEAANEEVRQTNASFALVSSGTAVTWVRRTNVDVKAFSAYPTHATTTPSAAAPEPEAAPPPPVEDPATAATPAKSGTPVAGAAPAKSGTPVAGAPASSAKLPAKGTTPLKSVTSPKKP